MKIWEKAIDNRVAVYLFMLMIIIVGGKEYFSLPREAAPDITIPLVIVSTPYVGVSAMDIEGLVTKPLEQSFRSLKDVKEIRSSSKEGLSTVQVEFNTGIDIDDAVRRVRDKVNSTLPELPQDILDPVVSEINFSEFPIMFINVGGDVGNARLRKIAEDLQDKIETVPGVLRVDLNGGLKPEVQINCDVNRLNAFNIGFSDIIDKIKSENLTIPGGVIDNGKMNYSIRIPGEFQKVKPLEDIIIKLHQGKPVYIRDVAEVVYGFEDRQSYARMNGTEVVSLAVRKRAGENLLRIAGDVKSIVREERLNVPPGVSLVISNDVSKAIDRQVSELENSIITGMALVVLVMFMFLGFKNSLLISTAIPLSMLIGFIVIAYAGITLNFVVLFALVLVLGILVDDAVVVIENIYRHQQDFKTAPILAAKNATAEVAVPVVSATITTVSPFVPLLFWPGVVGDFMSFLPITLIIMLAASLVVAFVISPVQGAVWINYQKEIRKVRENRAHPVWWRKYNPITYLYHKMDEQVFPMLQRVYVKTLHWTLERKGLTIGGSIALLVVVLVLFGLFNNGVEFFPSTQPNQVTVSIAFPPGTSLDVTNQATELLEDRIRGVKGRDDIEYMVANVGTSDDPFDFGGGRGTSNKSRISINFLEKLKRKQSSFTTMEEIRDRATNIAGADIKVEERQMGPPVGAPVSIEIAGEDYDRLASISADIQNAIRDVPNLVDLKDDYDEGKPEIEILVDREKAALFWTSTGQIANTVRAAVNGIEASKYRVGEDEYNIRVRLSREQRKSITDLERVHITFMNRRGQLLSIPLTSVATIKLTQGIASIRRKDLKRVVTITANNEGRPSAEVLKDVKARLKEYRLPAGYTLSFTGEDEEQKKAQDFLGNAFMIALLLVFLILVSEFNSLKIPVIIMASVALSLIGVLFGLLVMQEPFGIIMTGVGIISLAGIVVKNAIVLLDFVKQLRERGMSLNEALVEAGRVRLRPVILTAVTTAAGLLPLATGIDFDWFNFKLVIGAESADFWRPLALAVIFGLSFSTFLTLVLVPTMYALLEQWQKSLGARFRRMFRMQTLEEQC